jgi:hypothetical protein
MLQMQLAGMDAATEGTPLSVGRCKSGRTSRALPYCIKFIYGEVRSGVMSHHSLETRGRSDRGGMRFQTGSELSLPWTSQFKSVDGWAVRIHPRDRSTILSVTVN